MVNSNSLPKLIFIFSVLFLILLFKVQRTNPEISRLQEEVNETAVNYGSASLAVLSSSPPLVIDSPAPAFLAAYLDEEEVIGGRNQGLRWPLASITKLMTSLVAQETLDLNSSVKISEAAVAEEGVAGGFAPGETFTINDLIKAMLIVSSNDAASAIAEFYILIKKEPIVSAMNRKAEELGMEETNFADVTGLSVLNQATAEDLAKLARYLIGNQPEILAITRQPELEIIDLRSKIKRKLRNINEFAGNPDFLGGKTGFTDEANGNLFSIFLNSGRPVLIIVFGTENRFEETRKIYYELSNFRSN